MAVQEDSCFSFLNGDISIYIFEYNLFVHDKLLMSDHLKRLARIEIPF